MPELAVMSVNGYRWLGDLKSFALNRQHQIRLSPRVVCD